MKKANCPNCGGEISFRSTLSAFAVCPYCETCVVRTDHDLENIGKMASLPPDVSPIQLYTTGRFNGVHFVVVGRLRVSWSDGGWNEWNLAFGDGRQGWLADAQGKFAVTFKSNREGGFLELPRDVKRGHQYLSEAYKIDGKNFILTDVKEMTCIGSEGELPFRAMPGRKSTNYDFMCTDGRFASLEVSDDEAPALYTGEYASFRQLQLDNMRHFSGW